MYMLAINNLSKIFMNNLHTQSICYLNECKMYKVT